MQVAAATPLKPHNGTFRKGTQEQREPKMISPLLVLSFLLLPTSFVSSDVAFPLQVNSKLLKHMKKCELINTFVGSLVILIKHICVARLVIFTNIWILLPGWPPVIFANISPIRLVKLVDVWWRSMPPERELSLPVSTGALIS